MEKKGSSKMRDERGMVMVLVLLVMMATIVIGVSLMRSSSIETRVTGNERVYKQEFYLMDSGLEYIKENHATAMKTIANNINSGYSYTTTGVLPDFISGLTLDMILLRIGNPPLRSGYSVDDFESRFYQIDSSLKQRKIETQSFKVFPRES